MQTLFALAPLVLMAIGIHPAIAAIPAIYPFFILARRAYNRLRKKNSRTSLTGEHAIRILLGLLPVLISWSYGETGPLGWVTVSLLAVIPVAEPVLARVTPGRKLRVTHLPGVPDHRRPKVPVNAILLVDIAVTALASIMLLVGVPAGTLLPLPLLVLAFACVSALDSFQRIRDSVNADNGIYDAVHAHSPRFIIYYGVPTGSEYQIEMWMRFLERTGEPFIVILRHRSTFKKVARMTSSPVIVRNSMRQLDDVVVPSVTTAFYVNNGALNAHLVRYPQINHVQLLHGDSDKATSFNPITGMFDKIFVAGQAGIDRYKNNGIDIPAEKFIIVGRPQVEAVDQQQPENIAVQSVLYSPTWEGHFADTNYGSLSVGPQIIQALVERECTVVFRPHPYSYKNPDARQRITEIKNILRADKEASGREHLWGQSAESRLNAFECFNIADAMISDVSSVVPDFLHSGKPYGLVTMSFSVPEFEDMFPLARSAYVIERDLANLEQMLEELLVTDSKAEQRKKVREYYLGPFSAENYADAFVSAARNVVLHQQKPIDALKAATSEADEGGEGSPRRGEGTEGEPPEVADLEENGGSVSNLD